MKDKIDIGELMLMAILTAIILWCLKWLVGVLV